MRALLLFLVIPVVILHSAEGKIRGKVLDKYNNNPLTGVNIVLIGTPYGTTTDASGFFEMVQPERDTFRINVSLMGYSQTSIVLQKDTVSLSEIIIFLERKIIELSDITVTGSRPLISQYKYDLIQLPASKAKQMAGNLNDVVRSLSTLPGFAKPYDYRNDLMVRGGSPAENLFLIDGIIVPTINHFSNQGFTGGPVSFIDPSLISNMSISAGGFNSIYGDKLSAVIDLQLRESERDDFRNSVSVSGTQFSFNSEYSFGNNMNYLLSLRRSFLDPLFRIYGFFYYPEYYDLSGKYSWKPDQFNSLSFLFIGTRDEIKFFDAQKDLRNSNPRAVGSNQFRYITGISFRHLFSQGSIDINISRNEFKYVTIPNYFFSNNSFESETAIKGDLNYKINDNISIDMGAVISGINSRIDAEFYNYRSSYNEIFNAKIKNDKIYFKSGSYFNYTHHLNKLELNAGLRLDYFSPVRSDRTISPRLAAKYKIKDKTNIFFKTGVFHQTPSYVWLSGDPLNGALKSLRSDQLVVGFDHNINDLIQFKTETYIKQYSNYPVSLKRPYLVLANTGAEFAGTDNNFASYGIEPLVSKGTGTSKGIEVSVHHDNKIIPLNIDANISVSQVYFNGLDGIKRAGSFDQRVIINFLTAYKFNENWSANLRFFYASGAPYTPFDRNGIQQADKYNTLRMPSVHSLDFRLEKKFSAGAGSMVYLDLKNIYNRKNLYYYYFDTIKKEVSHDPVIRILPSFGITLQL